jgi:glutamate dehydrogenase (NADP+)
MIKYASGGKESFSGKKVAISGSGNVAQYAALKVIELGGTIVSLSDSKGTILSESGINPDLINTIAALKVERKALSDLSDSKVTYKEGVRPWKEVGKVDVALPCATQNEVSGDEAEALVSAGAKFIAEGSNMGCTQEAIDHFEKVRKEKKGEAIWYAPGKKSNTPLPLSAAELCCRQSSECWWRCRLRSRDGTELPATELDVGGGGREAEADHEELLRELPGNGEGIHLTC